MKREKCEYVKKCVFEYLAPAHEGKIGLSEVYRLFSDYGSIRELEKCLNGFVKNKIANKESIPGDKLFIFTQIIHEFGERWISELKSMKKQAENLKNQISRLNKTIKIIEEFRGMWGTGWDQIIEEPNTYANIRLFISTYSDKYLGEQFALQEKWIEDQKSLESNIEKLEEKIEESYRNFDE